MEAVKIPKRIDEPPTLLLWTIDELIPVVIGLLVGIMANQALIFTCIGLLLTRLYKKYRDNHPDGYFLHILYWYGFGFIKARSFPNPFVRELLP